MAALRCPLCPRWTAACYPEAERAERWADHIAGHSMIEAILALLRVREPKPPKPCPKVGYPSEQVATQTLLAAWRRRSPIRRETRSYHCQDCGYWHLTSKPAREKTA